MGEHFTQIENCDFAQCPREFVQLAATDNPKVRFCDQCQSPVYSCNSLRELKAHAQAGRCVSLMLERRDPSELQSGDLIKITSGQFQGFEGRIVEIDGAKRKARIELEIFGPGPCIVPTDAVGVINED